MHSVGSEVVVVAGEDGAPQAWPSAEGGRAGPAWVLVAPDTVAATRSVLAMLDEPDGPHPPDVRVVGWADLTAPNLVDLLDDLTAGTGGGRLAAIAVRARGPGGGWLEDVAVRRGLACLQRAGLSLRLLGTHPPEVVARLGHLEPELVLIPDEATSPASGSPAATG